MTKTEKLVKLANEALITEVMELVKRHSDVVGVLTETGSLEASITESLPMLIIDLQYNLLMNMARFPKNYTEEYHNSIGKLVKGLGAGVVDGMSFEEVKTKIAEVDDD